MKRMRWEFSMRLDLAFAPSENTSGLGSARALMHAPDRSARCPAMQALMRPSPGFTSLQYCRTSPAHSLTTSIPCSIFSQVVSANAGWESAPNATKTNANFLIAKISNLVSLQRWLWHAAGLF